MDKSYLRKILLLGAVFVGISLAACGDSANEPSGLPNRIAPDVPTYPNVVQISGKASNYDTKDNWMVYNRLFKTADNWEKVVDYYKIGLNNFGWRDIEPANTGKNFVAKIGGFTMRSMANKNRQVSVTVRTVADKFTEITVQLIEVDQEENSNNP